MGSVLFDEPDGNDLRRKALEGLLVELVRASLRPVTPPDLKEDALRLLDECWADVRAAEIDEVADDLEHDAIENDRWGFRATRPARSLDDAWPHLVSASEWADVVALTEAKAQDGADTRGQRQLFTRALLEQYEEVRLGARSLRGDQVARNDLIEANTRWAIQIVRNFAHHESASIDFDDLFQAACIGLVRAAEKFDPTLGYKFSTYSTWWIRQAIQRNIANDSRTIRIPVHIHERLRRVEREEWKYERENGHAPSTSELARLSEITEQQLNDVKMLPNTVPLEDALPESLVDRLKPDIEELVIDDLTAASVRLVLQGLTAREKQVIEERYGMEGEPRTLDDIGRSMDLTRERVRQIEVKALKRLGSLSVIQALAPPRRPEMADEAG